MGTGLMSEAEFERQIERFVDISNKINDDWQLVRATNGTLYMSKKYIVGAPHLSPLPVEMTSNSEDVSLTFVAPCDMAATPNISGSACSESKSTNTCKPPATSVPVGIQAEATSGPTDQPSLTAASTASKQNRLFQTKGFRGGPSVEQASQLSAVKPLKPTATSLKPTATSLKPTATSLTPTATSLKPASTASHSIPDCRQRQQNADSDLYNISQQATGSQTSWTSSPLWIQPVHPQKTSPISAVTEKETVEEDTGDRCLENVNYANLPFSLEEMEMKSDSEEEDCVMAHSSQQPPLTYEYHIIFSESYSVPVLYFNIFTPDGKLLPLDQVWNLCPPTYQAYIKENKWATLTQQEHPLLGRPFLQLHPCHTADLMAQVTRANGKEKEKNKHYLATWLSTVGPLIALKIQPEYVLG